MADDSRMNLRSDDNNERRLAGLYELYPEVFTEGKVDFSKLKNALKDFTDERPERYGLTWAGKSEAVRAMQTQSAGTLVPVRNASIEFDDADHLFIEGENLEVLKLLQKSYYGQIKAIYIDPPYNTGGEFIYPDNFREGLRDYLRYSGQIDSDGNRLTAHTEVNGRFHSRWLSMIYPRLFLARNLLREDGVLFVSIDDHEYNNLISLLNEVFGEENYIGTIVVQINPRGRHLDRFIAKTHEYLVMYARNVEGCGMNELVKDDRMQMEYDKEDKRGKYRELELRNRNPAFNSHTRPNLYYPLYVNPKSGSVSTSRDELHAEKVYPRNSKGEESCWTWSSPKAAKDRDLLIGRKVADGTWRIYRKDYFFTEDGGTATTKPKTLWLDKEMNNDYGKKAIQDLFGKTVFDFPKPPELIKRALRIGADDDCLVLDFFAGSGVTGQAVVDLNLADGGNRRYIMIQLPESIDDSTEAGRNALSLGIETVAQLASERMRLLHAKHAKTDASLPGTEGDAREGYKYFKLTSSNFKLWNADEAPKDGESLANQLRLYADHLVPGRTQEDILYELLLKAGLPLTVKIQEREVAGQKVFAVDEGLLLICLEEKIAAETLRGMITLGPQMVLCLDHAFAGNDQLKVNIVLEMRSHDIKFQTV